MEVTRSAWIHQYMFFEDVVAIMVNGSLLLLALKLPRNLKDTSLSDFERSRKTWVRNILYILSFLMLVWVFATVFRSHIRGFMNIRFMHILWAGITLVIYWVGFSGYERPELFLKKELTPVPKQPKQEKKEPTSNEEPQKYSSSSLSDIQATEILEKLTHAMEHEKMFRNPDLSLQSLSAHFDISPNYLSQVINEKTGRNFNDFVNTYRVEEVKLNLIVDKFHNYTILGIAMESGFSSKSGFNTIFKKMTGMTPSAFRKTRKV